MVSNGLTQTAPCARQQDGDPVATESADQPITSSNDPTALPHISAPLRSHPSKSTPVLASLVSGDLWFECADYHVAFDAYCWHFVQVVCCLPCDEDGVVRYSDIGDEGVGFDAEVVADSDQIPVDAVV